MGADLRGSAPGQRSSKETSQRWRSVGDDTVSDLTALRFQPQTFRTDSVCLTTELTGRPICAMIIECTLFCVAPIRKLVFSEINVTKLYFDDHYSWEISLKWVVYNQHHEPGFYYEIVYEELSEHKPKQVKIPIIVDLAQLKLSGHFDFLQELANH